MHQSHHTLKQLIHTPQSHHTLKHFIHIYPNHITLSNNSYTHPTHITLSNNSYTYPNHITLSNNSYTYPNHITYTLKQLIYTHTLTFSNMPQSHHTLKQLIHIPNHITPSFTSNYHYITLSFTVITSKCQTHINAYPIVTSQSHQYTYM